MKVLGSVKTSILKNTTWQNVNESFHFILEDVENSALRIELKQKLLNCKGKLDGGNTGVQYSISPLSYRQCADLPLPGSLPLTPGPGGWQGPLGGRPQSSSPDCQPGSLHAADTSQECQLPQPPVCRHTLDQISNLGMGSFNLLLGRHM